MFFVGLFLVAAAFLYLPLRNSGFVRDDVKVIFDTLAIIFFGAGLFLMTNERSGLTMKLAVLLIALALFQQVYSWLRQRVSKR